MNGLFYMLVNFAILGLLSLSTLSADDDYKIPPKAIADVMDTDLLQSINLSPDKKHLLILERTSLPSIAELSQPELRLAGLRINPKTIGRSRTNNYKSIIIKNIDSSKEKS